MLNGRLDDGRTSPHLGGLDRTHHRLHPAASGCYRWQFGPMQLRCLHDAYATSVHGTCARSDRFRLDRVLHKADRVQLDNAIVIATTMLRRRRRRHQRRTSLRCQEAATLTWFAWGCARQGALRGSGRRFRARVDAVVVGHQSTCPHINVNGAPCRCNGLVETRRSCTTPNREKVVTTPTRTVGEGPRAYLTTVLLLFV
jgi:hypothetical protein